MIDLPIGRLFERPLVDPRLHLDLERVQRYTQHLDELPPVTVFRLADETLLLADGYHRVAAAQACGRATVTADLRAGTKADAVAFASDVARHERGVSHQQAHAAIKRHSNARWSTEER
jgi:hypothetical protein